MVTTREAKGNQEGTVQDLSSLVERINAIRFAVERYNGAVAQYKSKNPNTDVEALLSEQKDLLPLLGLLSDRELDKFITYAKEQGTKMPFQAMEQGVLTAGRKDMQNGLAEILDSIGFTQPICSECTDKMENRGRSKKKSDQRGAC